MPVGVQTRGMPELNGIDKKKQRMANPSRINGHIKVTTVNSEEKLRAIDKPQISKKPTLAPKPKFLRNRSNSSDQEEYFTINQPRKINTKNENGTADNYNANLKVAVNVEFVNSNLTNKSTCNIQENSNQKDCIKQKSIVECKPVDTRRDCKEVVRNGGISDNSGKSISLSPSLTTPNSCINNNKESSTAKTSSITPPSECDEVFVKELSNIEENLTITNKPKETSNKSDSSDSRLQSNNNISEEMTSQVSNDTMEPVSNIRKRFEKMNIKFRRPSDSEAVTLSPPLSVSPQSPHNHANNLFKDIWSMKSEDLLDSLQEDNDNAQLTSSSLREENKCLTQRIDHDAEKPVNLTDLKMKLEREFNSNIINSLVSPTEKKTILKPQLAKKPIVSNRPANNFDNRRTQSLPRRFKGAYFKQFDQNFDELPPPPTPPPTPNVSSNNLKSLNYNSSGSKNSKPTSPTIVPSQKETISMNNSAVAQSTNAADVICDKGQISPLSSTPSQVNKQECYNLSGKSVGLTKRYLENYQQSVTADCSLGTPQANAERENTNSANDTFHGDALYYDNMLVMKQHKNKQQPGVLLDKDINKSDRNRQMISSSAVSNKPVNNSAPRPTKTSEIAKQEFHSALDDLEKEFMKLSDSIEISNNNNNANNNTEIPPKLPPKKRQTQNGNEKETNNITTTAPAANMSHNSIMDIAVLDTKSSIQMKMTHLEQQQILLQKLQERKKELLQQQQNLQNMKSIEDNRCSIIDEPLSTIEEEESNFGESCASSIADEGDNLFMSCASSQSTLNASDTDPNQCLLSDEETEVDVSNKNKQPEDSSSDEIQYKDEFRKSVFIEDDVESDVGSIEWTDSPMQNNRIPRSITDRRGYERDIAELTGAGKSWEQITNTSPKIEHKPNASTLSTSSSSSTGDDGQVEFTLKPDKQGISSNNSSNSETKSQSETNIEYNDDVTPYGVFDLSTLENPAPEKQKLIMSELGMNSLEPPRILSQPPNFSPKSPVFPMRQKKQEIVLPGYDNLEAYNVEVPPKERPKSGIGKHSTAVSALDRHEASLSRVKPANEPKSLDPPHSKRSSYERQNSSNSSHSVQSQINETNRNKTNKPDQFPAVDSESSLQSRELPAKPMSQKSTEESKKHSTDTKIKYTPIKKDTNGKNHTLAEKANNTSKRFSNHYEELANYSKNSDEIQPSITQKFDQKYSSTKTDDNEIEVQDIMDNILPSRKDVQAHALDKSFPVEAEDNIDSPLLPSKNFNYHMSSDSSRSNTLPRRSSNSNNRPQHDAYFNVGHDEEAFESGSNFQSECSRAYDADTDGAVDVNKRGNSNNGDLSSDDDSFIYPNRPRANVSNIDNRNKMLSPSMRKKRSLLERSKSPSKHSSRRSKSPSLFKKSKSRGDDSDKASSNTESPRKESRVKKFRRSFRRRSIKSGDESNKDDRSDDLKSDVSSPPPVPARIAMRRSKSQDRETATKEYRKHKKKLRSKSLERPQDSEYDDDGAISTGSKRSSGFFSRGSKRFSRGRSSERRKSIEEPKRSHSRGRNPVSFIRKLLRRNKSTVEGDPNIIRIPDSPEDSESKQSDGRFPNMTYKESRKQEQRERRNWTPPRSSPVTQKPIAAPRMRSPLSHRAKKMQRNKVLDTGSSSEASSFDRTRTGINDHYENLGNKRVGLRPPSKPPRGHSRDNSFSNSAPSSDSDASRAKRSQITESDATSDGSLDRRRLSTGRLSGKNKKATRSHRPYSGHSKGYSDHESSTDVDGKHEVALKSSLRKGPVTRAKCGTLTSPPRRPVRVISPRLSQSDPSLFAPNAAELAENCNLYYNVFENNIEEVKPPLPYKRRSMSKPQQQSQPSNMKDDSGPLATQQRQKYRTLVSLNAQTLKKVSEKWLSEWRNDLPVGGFLITSWSDVTITSKRPLCMIGNSVIYPAHFTSNPEHRVACQLFDQNSVSSRFLRQLENCSTLTANPNICGVCSHFICRIPRHMLDPSSRSGMVDAVCVVLYSRPVVSLTEYLQRFVNSSGDVTDMHRQLLLVLIQLLKGLDHLAGSGFSVSNVTLEHLVISQERGLLQILPHLEWRCDNRDSDSSSDNSTHSNTTTTYQVIHLIKKILKRSFYANNINSQYSGRNKSLPIVPGSPYSIALQTILTCLESPGLKPDNNSIISIAQCALWGPRELDDIDYDDVQPFSSLELWIDMEQAKLVNSLAVLPSGKNEPMKPSVFLKYQYFSQVNPQSLFQCLKTLERI